MGSIGFDELLLMALFLLPTVWAIMDIVRSEFRDPANKIVWVIVVIMVPILGAVLYALMRKSQKKVASEP